MHHAIVDGKIASAYALGYGGIIEAVSKMAFGNKFGVCLCDCLSEKELYQQSYGSIVLEVQPEYVDSLGFEAKVIGSVTDDGMFVYKNASVSVDEALEAWQNTLEKVFPTTLHTAETSIETKLYDAKDIYVCKHKVAKPQVFIPVFPGTNCEYDSMRAFKRAGADVKLTVFRNQNAEDIRESVEAFAHNIKNSQIMMLPGGFSAGDEPDGSGKFITSVLRNPKVSEAVMELLNKRDGLVLGICNGFQALIKLGLLPYGEILPQTADSPTLTMNTIGRHQSKVAYTKVVSNKSPWLRKAGLGDVYSVPISHGEGRFVATNEWLEKLFANGQVATQYVDLNGNPTMNDTYNMNGSYMAIEGITSLDGRVLGKMAHSERIGNSVAINIYGTQDQQIFESGVEYFK